MGTPYDEAIEHLRRASLPERPQPPAFGPYLDKVHNRPYTVLDGDVEQLRELGFSEDEIFEQTVSTAVAAGLERLDAALRVVE